MKILLIETATERALLVLVQNGRPLATRSLTGDSSLSHLLAREVKNLLQEHAFLPEKVAVGTGPGSYTGIRVGVALAKALAYGWGVPLIGIGSLEGFAPPTDGPFAVVVDARSGGFYVLEGERRGPLLHCSPPLRLLPTQVPLDLLIASPHPHLIQKRLGPIKNILETAPDPTLLSALASLSISQPPTALFPLSYCSNP